MNAELKKEVKAYWKAVKEANDERQFNRKVEKHSQLKRDFPNFRMVDDASNVQRFILKDEIQVGILHPQYSSKRVHLAYKFLGYKLEVLENAKSREEILAQFD